MNSVTPVATIDDERAPADRVADAAIAVIAGEGLDALSVRATARAASLSGGAVQHHFPTKIDLTLAAFERVLERQRRRVADVAREPSPFDTLVAQLDALLPVDAAGREEAVVWLAMSAAVPGNAAIARRHAAAVAATRAWIAHAVRRGQDAGELDVSLDPGELAPLIEAALDGLLLQAVWSAPAERSQVQARLRDVVGLILRPAPDRAPPAATRRAAR